MEKEKEMLEKKIEDLEAAGQTSSTTSINNNNDIYKPHVDMLRLDEVTAENEKLRDSLDSLRQSIAQSAEEEGAENSAVREMMDQFSSLSEELDRKKEECLNLKTLLANSQVDNKEGHEAELDPQELFQAYESQKNVIQQLQSSLNEEREK